MLRGNAFLLPADGGGQCICGRVFRGDPVFLSRSGVRSTVTGNFTRPAVAAAGQASRYPWRAMGDSVGDEDRRPRRGRAEIQQAPKRAGSIGYPAQRRPLVPGHGTWC